MKSREMKKDTSQIVPPRSVSLCGCSPACWVIMPIVLVSVPYYSLQAIIALFCFLKSEAVDLFTKIGDNLLTELLA